MHQEKTAKAATRKETRKDYRAPVLQKSGKLSEITRGTPSRVS